MSDRANGCTSGPPAGRPAALEIRTADPAPDRRRLSGRELRIAYTGTCLAGRRTSMEYVHRKLRDPGPVRRPINEEGGRWLAFSVESSAVRLTVVGSTGAYFDLQLREHHIDTAHAVVLLLDSQECRAEANKEICELVAPRIGERPVIVQLTKRDLPHCVPVEELLKTVGTWRSYVFESVVPRGTGVWEAFECAALLAGRSEGLETEVRTMIEAY